MMFSLNISVVRCLFVDRNKKFWHFWHSMSNITEWHWSHGNLIMIGFKHQSLNSKFRVVLTMFWGTKNGNGSDLLFVQRANTWLAPKCCWSRFVIFWSEFATTIFQIVATTAPPNSIRQLHYKKKHNIIHLYLQNAERSLS